MIELTPEEIEYWNERADEPIVGEPVIMTAEEQAEFEVSKRTLYSLEKAAIPRLCAR